MAPVKLCASAPLRENEMLMKLQTQLPFQKNSENLLDYNSRIFLLGSCFVENIGQKLDYFKLNSHQNPFGVLFHPKAIETLVLRAIQEIEYEEEDVFFPNELWHCYEVHSQMSHSSKDDLIAYLNKQLQLTRQHLKEASHIILTLGTAWVYKHYKSNLPVANCHKMSQRNFKKELLTIVEITGTLQNLRYKIKELNAHATVILTVSPIRHIKDGFVENTRSKAHLIAAVHDFISQASDKENYYFPSYEIMMDELRDYRFYAEDMLHPNATAITYIWEKFLNVWMSESAVEIMEEVGKIQKAMAHEPFNPQSDAHAKFLKQLKLKKKALQNKFGHIVF